MTNIAEFEKRNVADACSLWNILASRLLASTADSVGVRLRSTTYVRYKCLHKPGLPRPERKELQKRLLARINAGGTQWHPIDIEDLQEFEILRNRKSPQTGSYGLVEAMSKRQIQNGNILPG